ncbi:hypothetical protein BJV74DRAFT_860366 [Russula compacta]|nr:hypothetical protein BJV74DRAFT_860366 [Russula compacta]
MSIPCGEQRGVMERVAFRAQQAGIRKAGKSRTPCSSCSTMHAGPSSPHGGSCEFLGGAFRSHHFCSYPLRSTRRSARFITAAAPSRYPQPRRMLPSPTHSWQKLFVASAPLHSSRARRTSQGGGARAPRHYSGRW